MNLDHAYLENIHNLITDIIPFNICKHYSFIPLSIDNRIPRRVLFAMVDPENIIACDILKKYVHRKNYKYKKSYITPEDYERLIKLYLQYLDVLEQDNKLKLCLKKIQYHYTQIQTQTRSLGIFPKSSDLVLGGKENQDNIKQSLAILGGIEGVKYKLRSKYLPIKIQALHDSLKYPEQCQLILLEVIKQKQGLMVWVAYSLLRDIASLDIQKKLHNYEHKLNPDNLDGINLEKVNLQNINLLHSNLKFANFRGTIINEITQLKPQLLLQWQMVNQGLKDCDLSKFIFSQADLSYSQLTNINLRYSQFLEVKLIGTNLDQLDCLGSQITKVSFQNSHLIYLDLRNSKLTKINFTDSRLEKISLSQSKLLDINFQGCHINNVDFHGSLLENIDFSEANLTNVNFKNTILKNIKFNQTKLENVDMSYLDLSKAQINLNYLDLRNSKFIRTNFEKLNLSHTNLSGANLSGANLSGVNLGNANLHRAKLTLATFNRDTIFPPSFNPRLEGAVWKN